MDATHVKIDNEEPFISFNFSASERQSYEFKTLNDVPTEGIEKLTPFVENYLEKHLSFLNFSQNAEKKDTAIRVLIGAMLTGVNVNTALLEYLQEYSKGTFSRKRLERELFPMKKLLDRHIKKLNEKVSLRTENINKRLESIFGDTQSNTLIMPLDTTQPISLRSEIENFIAWYNEKIRMPNDEKPLIWSPDEPNRTYTHVGDKKIAGPKLMKLLKGHDWFLSEYIEELGGIGTAELFKEAKKTVADEFAENKADITMDHILQSVILKDLGCLRRIGSMTTSTYDLVPDQAANQFSVVISADPVLIGEMSTEQIWKSCMNLYEGIERERMPNHVTAGNLVAYLVHKDDVDCRYPLMRRNLIAGYKEEDEYLEEDIAYGIERQYGLGVGSTISIMFLRTLQKFVTKYLNKNLSGVFCANPTSYNDGVHEFNAQASRISDGVIDSGIKYDEFDEDEFFPELLTKEIGQVLKEDLSLEDVTEFWSHYSKFNRASTYLKSRALHSLSCIQRVQHSEIIETIEQTKDYKAYFKKLEEEYFQSPAAQRLRDYLDVILDHHEDGKAIIQNFISRGGAPSYLINATDLLRENFPGVDWFEKVSFLYQYDVPMNEEKPMLLNAMVNSIRIQEHSLAKRSFIYHHLSDRAKKKLGTSIRSEITRPLRDTLLDINNVSSLSRDEITHLDNDIYGFKDNELLSYALLCDTHRGAIRDYTNYKLYKDCETVDDILSQTLKIWKKTKDKPCFSSNTLTFNNLHAAFREAPTYIDAIDGLKNNKLFKDVKFRDALFTVIKKYAHSEKSRLSMHQFLFKKCFKKRKIVRIDRMNLLVRDIFVDTRSSLNKICAHLNMPLSTDNKQEEIEPVLGLNRNIREPVYKLGFR